MHVSRCTKENVIETFPIKFLLIFFIFGFGSCLLGCIFVSNSSFFKFIPLVIALILESTLALTVGLMKSDHSEQLLSQLHDTFDCYKRGMSMMTQLYDNINSYSLKGMDDVQAQFNCCGVIRYEEWLDASLVIPHSCCAHLYNCTLFGIKDKSGCYDAMKKDVYGNWNAMIMFIIIFVFIKLIILVMYVCNAVTNYHESSEKSDTISHVTEK